MEKERQERRKSMMQQKEARNKMQAENIAKGNPGDVDFIGMVENWRKQQRKEHQAKASKSGGPSVLSSNICIAVRKRPMSGKERAKLDHDSVSVFSPQVTIHSAKFRVDGITKYLTHNSFQLDFAFDETSTTEDIYVQTTLPLVDHVLASKGRATIFCYGQTGSGKTFTMNGIQQILAYDLYAQISAAGDLDVQVAMFELYGGFVQDLLHEGKRCKLLEDAKGEVNITGLEEVPAQTAEDFLKALEKGNSLRTTHTTEANDTSSRSHAICQVLLRDPYGKLKGKLTLVDLAGSERGSDTKSHNSQRRTESAEINTSLLSLKECIRALGQKSTHVPYRGSKLTLLLKDCFSPDSKTTMVATVSPGASSTDHSLNTLRYADRIKEQRTTTGTSNNRSSAKTTGGGILSPRPLAPSKKRLQLIANANQIAKARRDAAADEILAQENRTLSPTGLVTMLSPTSAFIEEDDPESSMEMLLAEDDSTDALLEEEDGEYEPSEADDLDDEDYDPEEEEGEEDSLEGPHNTVEEDEEEMRRVVQARFDAEEALLNQHMSTIQEHAEMLTHEGKLLQSVQGASEDEIDEYAIQLAEFLDRKEILICKLQQKRGELKTKLAREREMAQRFPSLSQF